jgi:hypothetical protein
MYALSEHVMSSEFGVDPKEDSLDRQSVNSNRSKRLYWIQFRHPVGQS